MSARYYVLVSDELLGSGPDWESVDLHLIERGGFTEPGMRWCLFLDDHAREDFEGKRVDLSLGTVDGKTFITGRRVIA